MRLACAACAALILAAPAAAQMPQIDPGRYLCATIAGKGVNQDIVPLKPGQELRLAFRLIDEDKDPTHPPIAVVHFNTAKGSSRIAVGRSVNDPHQMFVVLLPDSPQRMVYEFPLTDEWIILRLKLDDRGNLSVSDHGREPKFPLGSAEITRTMLQCGGGDWEFDVWPRSYVPAAGAAHSAN